MGSYKINFTRRLKIDLYMVQIPCTEELRTVCTLNPCGKADKLIPDVAHIIIIFLTFLFLPNIHKPTFKPFTRKGRDKTKK